MAIDMIENNDLGALSQSRYGGSKTFIDESYANFSLRGKKYFERKRAREEGAKQFPQFDIPSDMTKDCEYLQSKLDDIQEIIKSELAKNPSKQRRNFYVNPLYDKEANIKRLYNSSKCADQKARVENERFKKETEEAINRASASTPEIPNVMVAKGSKTTTYVLIGVGVVVLGIVALKLLKK